jgi:GDP/UDP-N,N'-diacetylbacillosamine 2-epimerase (hydrolysing)
MKKICAVTGTRAEYGLLRPILEFIQKDEQLSLQLIVTGTHLCNEHGNTYQDIEKDGFSIDCKVDLHLTMIPRLEYQIQWQKRSAVSPQHWMK